jgi:uncharacterized membrane protein YkvA (DUF1232 family)
MEWWQIALIVTGSIAVLLVLTAYIVWRKASAQTRRLAERVQRLPWRAKFSLARALVADERVPVPARIIPLLLIAYLAMPLDIVPDFVPVLGQLDDVLVVAVGMGLMLRMTAVRILEEHLAVREQLDAGEMDTRRPSV